MTLKIQLCHHVCKCTYINYIKIIILFLIVEIFHNATVLAVFMINLNAALTSFKNFQKCYREYLTVFTRKQDKNKNYFHSNDPF